MYCVYTVFNKITGKFYIGKTKNYRKRINQHLSVAKRGEHDMFFIHRAIRKYGADNFTFNVLQYFNNELTCLSAEKYWISYFKSNDPDCGYNLTEGGEHNFGAKRSPETKRKMSLSKLGKKRSLEDKIKINQSRMGIVLSESHRNNMSKARQGKYDGENNNFYGQTHSIESKKKFSGENHGLAKLNDQKVIDILEKYQSGNYTQQGLANKCNVSFGTINAILSGKTWKHIPRNK